MKGSTLNHLELTAEEKLELEVWGKILQTTNDDGVFVWSEVYADERLVKLVIAIHDCLKIPVFWLMQGFSICMFRLFITERLLFIKAGLTHRASIQIVDKVMHFEVRKLHTDVNLPKLTYRDEGDQGAIMFCPSPRQMCHLVW